MAGLGPPERDQLLQLLGLLVGQVVALARVVLGVEELPALRREVRPSVCGAAGDTAAAFQPWCQMARVPSIEKNCVCLAVFASASSNVAAKLTPSIACCV